MLNSLTIGLLPILIKYKTSFLTNLISKPLYTLFAIFLMSFNILKRQFLNVLLSRVRHFILLSRVGRNNNLLTSLLSLISWLYIKGLVIKNKASC